MRVMLANFVALMLMLLLVAQTPQDIMEEYNGCSAPQYRSYRCGPM